MAEVRQAGRLGTGLVGQGPMVAWKGTTEFHPAPLDLAAFVRERGLTLPIDRATGGAPTVIVDRSAWDALWDHARSADVEVGGLLLGEVFRDTATDQPVVVVQGAVPAIGGASSAVSFTFTPDAWDHLTAERDRKWPDLITVGWFHTHPNLGVFYSGTDRATQRAFFNQPWNIGIVVDPLAWSDQVALFAGADSQRLPASDIVVAPEPVAVAVAPEPLVIPAARPVGRSAWRVYGPRVAAAAAGAAAGLVAAVVADRMLGQRREP